MVRVLAHMKGEAVLKPYMLVNSTLAHEPEFLSEQERAAWLAVESGMMKLLLRHQKVIVQLGSIQAALQKEFRSRSRAL
jgi:hypothetical protein